MSDYAELERKRQKLQERLDAFLPRMQQTAVVLAAGAIAVTAGHFGVVDSAHNHALVSQGLAIILEMGGALTMATGALIGISHLFSRIRDSGEMLALRHKLSVLDGREQAQVAEAQDAPTLQMPAIQPAEAPRLDL